MSKKVDLDRLEEALHDYHAGYLVSVDDDYHPHITAITPAYDAGVVDVGPVGKGSRRNLSRRGDVSVVWPPREVGDYSLIVDGRAELPDDPNGRVRITPTRAVLHRPVILDPTAPGCVYDCVDLAVQV